MNLKEIKKIAVVGASNNPEKTGYRIVQNLIARGFEVFPINLKESLILDRLVYHSISELPEKVDLIDIVIPSEQGINVIQEALALGYRKFWIQPGAESEEILALLEKSSEVDYIANSCIMLNK